MDKTNNTLSDVALLQKTGLFVKHHRLKQNVTQLQLAKTAGINRSTLVDFEKGKRSNTLTLVQILRALNLLHVFNVFDIEYQLSPMQLAKAAEPDRQRAYAPRNKNEQPLSDW